MIRGNRIFAGALLALLVVGALSGAAALAEEGVDEAVQETEAPLDVVATLPSEDVGDQPRTSPAEEPAAEEPIEATEPTEAEPDGRARDPRPRPARNRGSGGRNAAAGASVQPGPDGQGTIEIDPESAAGACPGGTAFKIDGLRSNGTFGPITISDYTNTSFTWTSTEAVSAVLVKDGGGHKTNPGGSSGFASTFGQDISHVIFCLGGDVPDAGTAPEEPCDADATMPGTQSCEPPPCDADATMPGTQPCEPPVCDGDATMPGTQPCEPPPCDGDETMPGTQPCAPKPCDADETMPGRQDCTVAVGDVESKPEKDPAGSDVQGAGLSADRAPEVAPMAAQPVAQGATLPFTGGELAAFVTIAGGLVTAGGGAVLIRRP